MGPDTGESKTNDWRVFAASTGMEASLKATSAMAHLESNMAEVKLKLIQKMTKPTPFSQHGKTKT
jgi:hypothetical protein